MSWSDLLKEETPKKKEDTAPQPKKTEDTEKKLREKIAELESEIDRYKTHVARVLADNQRIKQQLEYYRDNNTEITAADKRNLQFLVNCVAKTYKIEFRKNRAPAVRLALTNIIEKFNLERLEEMN